MAEDKSTDILMKFVISGAQAIPAECSTDFDWDWKTFSGDQLEMLRGFDTGYFFEVDKISLGLDKPKVAAAAGGAVQAAGTDLGEISVTRRIDQASLTLMDCCFKAKTLASATIIKRRAAGSGMSGEPYLRIDFNSVLITKLNWDDSAVVTEKCSFICKEMVFMYRAQNAAGELGSISPAKWNQVV